MRKTFIVILMLTLTSYLFVYGFKVDGIYYEYVGKGRDSVVVTEGGWNRYYKGDVVIPSSVVYEGKISVVCEIGSSAFSGCDGLTSVTIPNSVTTIGEHAFYNCDGLTSVTIPNSVTTIEWAAFSGCDSLKSIIISNSVTTIGSSAFSYCRGLTSVTIPNSVTTIGSSAFYSCDGLTSVTIPNSVTTIEISAFENCRGLKSIIIPNSVTTIGISAFSNCDGLTSVTIPNSITTIGSYAFEKCRGLTSVTIPNGVTTIGGSAFENCDGLTSVTISNSVTTIGSSAFRSCNGLTSVTIPNSVTIIGGSAFENCDGLTSVTIPNSVTTIGSYAFENCDGLTSVILSNGSVDIDKDAFENCKSLKHISVPKDFDLKRLNLPREIKVTYTPIILSELTIDSVKYEGKTKDGEIRCNEKGNLYVLVRNSSYGKAKGAIAKIMVSGATKGIVILKEQKLGDLPQKQSTWVKIPIETTEQIIDGKIIVKVMVNDDYGVKSNKKEIEIKTHELHVSDLKIIRYELLTDFDTVLTKEKVFELKLTLKNEGEKIAKNHELMAFVPEGLKMVSDSKVLVSNILPDGEIDYVFMLYSSAKMKDNVAIRFEIHNPEVKTKAENYNVDLQFNKTKTTPKNIIQNFIPERVGIDSIAIVGSVVLQQYTSLELISNKWARYKSNHVVLKIKISGDKPETIRRAKELLNVNLGTLLGVSGVHKGEPNEVWFLIPVEARRILLTCGDGCREIEIWNGELKNNSVYQGEIRVY